MPHILNVTVPIPETHVLITKDEYDELNWLFIRPCMEHE